jgi:hypothetical protein
MSTPPSVHENAFNLARRLSARNEPDLLRKFCFFLLKGLASRV